MRPDAQFAMLRTIDNGPTFCPDDMFAGPRARVMLGLKAHANAISFARHVAMEQTYPRTRASFGIEGFHQAAARHLDDPQVRRRPLSEVGLNFPSTLTGPARDLARLEWAWLEAHGAFDADAFDLSAVASLEPEVVAATQVTRHPAARLVPIDHSLEFDGVSLPGPAALVARQHSEVQVVSAGAEVVRLFKMLGKDRTLGVLLEADETATTELVTNGALAISRELEG